MRGVLPSNYYTETAAVSSNVSIWLQLAAAYVFLIPRRPFLCIVSVESSALFTTAAALTTYTAACSTAYLALNLSYCSCY